MPFSAPGGLAAAIDAATGAWPMAFSSVHYLLLLPLAVGAYFLLPGVLRRA